MVKISNYLKVSEAAEHLGVSKDTVRRWDAAGKPKARRHPVSNFWLYLQADLDSFLAHLSRGTSGRRSDRSHKRSAGKR